MDALGAKIDIMLENVEKVKTLTASSIHRRKEAGKMSTKMAAGAFTSKSASRSRVKTVEITKNVAPSTSWAPKNKTETAEKKKKTVAKAIPRDDRVKQPPKNKPGAALTSTPKVKKKENRKPSIRLCGGVAGVIGGIPKGKEAAPRGAVAASAVSLDESDQSETSEDSYGNPSDDYSDPSDDSYDDPSDDYSDPSDHGDHDDPDDDMDAYDDSSYEGEDNHQESGW